MVAIIVLMAAVAGCIGDESGAPDPDDDSGTAEEDGSAPDLEGSEESGSGGDDDEPSSGAATDPTTENSTESGDADSGYPSWFEAPHAMPGHEWKNVTFSADVPARQWLFVYQPFAGGPRSFEDRLPFDMTIYGDPTGDGPSAYMTTSPFLLDAQDNKLETFFLEQEAGYDPDGGSWQIDTFWNDLYPRSNRLYAGVGFLGASLTDWHVDITITAPGQGNVSGIVGPDIVHNGTGFWVGRLPPMSDDGETIPQKELQWNKTFQEGWTAIQMISDRYICVGLCTDVVMEESWEIRLPGESYTFSQGPTGGSVPGGFPSFLRAPEGDVSIEGSSEGFAGDRIFTVFHASVPRDIWPEALIDDRLNM